MAKRSGKGRRWIRRGLIAMAAGHVAYLLAANAFLRTDWGPSTIHRAPDNFEARWGSAWTVVPGLVHVRDLHLRGQTGRTRWAADLDRVRFRCRFWGLAAKRFTARGIVGHGLTFRLVRRPAPGEPPPDGARTPAFPVFTTPLTGPPPGPPPPPRAWPWRISLGGVSIDGVREVWIDEQRMTGTGSLHGDWTFTPGGAMEMDGSTLAFEEAKLWIGEEAAADRARLIVDVHFDRFVPREHRKREVLRFASGRVRFRSPRSRFGFLDRYFGRADWLAIDGHGAVEADVRVANGRLERDGRLEIADAELDLTALEFHAAGRGGVRARSTADRTSVEARLTAYTLRRLGAPPGEVLAEGDDFTLFADGDPIDLAGEPPQLAVRLSTVDATIPDLAAYNRLLPPDSPLVVRSGAGRFSAELSLGTAGDSGTGTIDIRARGMTLAYGDVAGSGDARFAARLAGAQLERRRFDLSGSTLDIDDFAVDGAPPSQDGPWWARIGLPSAQVDAGPTPGLAATFEAGMRDSRPIVTLLAEQKPLVGWIDGLLTVEDVTAQGRVGLDASGWSVDRFRIAGEKLEVLGDRLRLTKGHTSGLLLFGRGRLSAAVELEGDARDWKLIGSRRWYAERGGRTPETAASDERR